eukprot:3941980-Rhodomonas_salina.6
MRLNTCMAKKKRERIDNTLSTLDNVRATKFGALGLMRLPFVTEMLQCRLHWIAVYCHSSIRTVSTPHRVASYASASHAYPMSVPGVA